MATCPKDTIDSNAVGLRFAWERCLRELWPVPLWKPLEPNSFADFGQTVTTVARNPINPARKRKKGKVTDLDANGGFNQDVTQTNTTEILQGFFFANARERGTTISLHRPTGVVNSATAATDTYAFTNASAATVAVAAGGTGYKVGDVLSVAGGTGVQAAVVLYVSTVNAGTGAVTALAIDDRGQYGALPANPAATTGGLGVGCTVNLTSAVSTMFNAGELVLASGFNVVANNGLKTVVSMAGGALVVGDGLVDEAAPPTTAALQTVGFQFDADEIDVVMNGGLVRLTADTFDMTTLGIIPGEWIFVGGSAVGNRFANSFGFARVSVITEEYLQLDKVQWENAAAESGAGKSLQIFFGSILRDEVDPDLIIFKPVQLERTLGKDVNGTMSEYLIGGACNELTLNVSQASICTADMTFVACEVEHRTGLQGLKTGARPLLNLDTDAFNTTNNLARLKMSVIDPVTATPVPLFDDATDATITINNNMSANKALGRLGAIGVTAGTFEVGGEMTVYFTDVAGPQAVRSNADVTVDYIFVEGNAGMVWDIPLLALGGGNIQVEQNQAITMPLETNAAESAFGHTLLVQSFAYLPDGAAA